MASSLLALVAAVSLLAAAVTGRVVSGGPPGASAVSGVLVVCPAFIAVGRWDHADSSMMLDVDSCPAHYATYRYVAMSVWGENWERVRFCLDQQDLRCIR